MKPTKSQAEVLLEAIDSASILSLEAGAATKARPFKMEPAYSGAPFDHPFFGRAVIDVAGVRVPDGGVPIYRQHDPSKFIGRSSKVELAAKRVDVVGFLFDGVAEADEVARISDQGGKWQASVKADPNLERVEYVGAGEAVVVNGLELAGPLAVLRETFLREVSFTPRGVDASTSAIALSHAAHAATPKKETTMDPLLAERQRVADIRKAFPKHVNFALEQIEKGVSLAEAKAAFADVVLAEGEAALAAANARAEAAEKKAADAARQSTKPSAASLLGAPGATSGAPDVALSADDAKDPIKRWELALSVEIDRLTRNGEGEVEELGARRTIALSADANRRALAVSNLMARDPALREAYVAEVNHLGIGSRARNNKAR